MKPIIIVFIKTYIAYFISFSIFWAIVPLDFDISFLDIFRRAFICSFMSSFFMIYILKNKLKKKGIIEFTKKNLSVVQSEKFETALTIQEIIEKLRESASVFRMKMILSGNTIFLKKKMNWKTWGDKIKISINESDTDKRIIHLISRPKYLFTVMDFGRNLENVELFKSILETK